MAIIDFVEWRPEESQTVYAYRFPETNLSTYTQLVVQESQEAVLFSKGQIAGKFGPGKHTLNTENLPILRSLYGLPFGKKNPFTAEVWFVNKLQPCNIEWKIDRMDVHDADYNTGIPFVASGRYGLTINDAERFLIKIVGTRTSFDEFDLSDQFYGEYSTKTKSTIVQFMTNNRIGLKQVSAHLDNISQHLKAAMIPFWESYGFQLNQFYVTNIEVDDSTDAGRRIIDAISRQSAQAIGGYTWQQSQAFETAKDAIDGMSEGGGGLLGAVVASNMMGGMGGMMQPQYNQPTFNPNSNAPTPQNQNQNVQVKEVYCSNCSKKFTNNNRFCPHCGDEYTPCPKCGTDNDKSASRCVSCGTQLSASGGTCSQCGAGVAPGAAFCNNCGNNLNAGINSCSRCGNTITPTTKFCPNCGQKNA